jgi:hypothetical protein
MVHRLLLLLGCSVVGVGLAGCLAMLLDPAPQGSNVGPPEISQSKDNQAPLWAEIHSTKPDAITLRIEDTAAALQRLPPTTESPTNAPLSESLTADKIRETEPQTPLASSSPAPEHPADYLPKVENLPEVNASPLDFEASNANSPFPDAVQVPSESPKPPSTPSVATPKPVIHFPPIPAKYRRETLTRNSQGGTPIAAPFHSNSAR